MANTCQLCGQRSRNIEGESPKLPMARQRCDIVGSLTPDLYPIQLIYRLEPVYKGIRKRDIRRP